MRQFAAKQPAEVQLRLMSAIDSARPARDFSMAVRRVPDMALAWQNERFQRVMEPHRCVEVREQGRRRHLRPAADAGRSG